MRPGIFVSRTGEKLGRTCDQIGRTLEPCIANLCISSLWSSSKNLRSDSVRYIPVTWVPGFGTQPYN